MLNEKIWIDLLWPGQKQQEENRVHSNVQDYTQGYIILFIHSPYGSCYGTFGKFYSRI